MRARSFAALGFTLFACGVACGEAEPTPPDQSDPPPIVRPARVEALSVARQTFSLPAELRGDASLTVAVLEGTGALVGGAGGLFQIAGDQLVAIDSAPVTALAPAPDGAGIVVARQGGVSLWNGALIASPLTDALEGMSITALLERSGSLFIGTGASLYLLQAGELFQFESIESASQLAGFAAGGTLVIGGRLLLREDAGWDLQDLAAERPIETAIPAAGDRLFAIESGALLERIAVEGGAAWRSVALTDDPADEGATGVFALATDPIAGDAWVVTAARVARIAGGAVASMDYPVELDGAPLVVRTTQDGALWISDGTSLVRLGDDDGPVTYANDIAAFSLNNCQRCHKTLGVAHPLDSFEVWRDEIDKIITQLDQMTMPQDGALLRGGTVELIRTWKSDGLLP